MTDTLYVPINFGCSAAPKQPIEVKLISLQFVEHVKDFRSNELFWTKDGAYYPVPQFRYGEPSAPVVYVRGRRVAVTIELDVFPENLAERTYTLAGKANWDPPLSFSEAIPLRGGRNTVNLMSKESLPDRVTKLSGNISWSVSAPWFGAMPAGESWGHVLYVVYGKPRQEGNQPEVALTAKRMDAAVAWVAETKTLELHPIVKALMDRFESYTLMSHPAVPVYYYHPSFLGQDPDHGGAWPLVDYAFATAECQAICRLTRAIVHQVGVPGDTDIYVVYALPDGKGGFTVEEADWERSPDSYANAARMVNGRKQQAKLLDDVVVVGRTYPPSHTGMPDGSVSPGLNNFEACLRYADGKKTLYYGGGAGVSETKEEVIMAFTMFAWVEVFDDLSFKVMEIITTWRSTSERAVTRLLS